MTILECSAEVRRSPSKSTFWTLGVAAAFIPETAWNLFMLSYMLLDFKQGEENPPISSLALHCQTTWLSGQIQPEPEIGPLNVSDCHSQLLPYKLSTHSNTTLFFFLSTSCWINKSWRDKSKRCISRGQKLEKEVHAWLMSMRPATSHSALVTTITTSFSCHITAHEQPHDRKRISLTACSCWRSVSLSSVCLSL